jgi:membrane fusion protein, copper/silver efflux system
MKRASLVLLGLLAGSAFAADRAPLYWQDPDGKPAYAAAPRKTDDGRDYVAVFEDAPAAKPTAARAERKIVYYRNPMGLPDTSPKPKKDSMGMDYIPVYADEANDDSVRVAPGRLQTLGVVTAPAELRALARTVRAVGTVKPDERKLAVVSTKLEGWIETLRVDATGQAVKRGDVLFELYSPTLLVAEREYLAAAEAGPQIAQAALARLRALDVPDDEIARLRTQRTVPRRIAFRATADGLVLEKNAIAGMRVMPGDVLYRTAELSTVWVIADVFEQDLGQIRVGAAARVRVDAYPQTSFEGRVDFVYPMLDARTRTAKVRVVVPNPELRLLGDMYANVEIVGVADKAVAVPDSAVIDDGTRRVVLVDRGEGRFQPRTVKTGARADGWIAIVDGLQAGERVVTRANFLIDAESNLRAALQPLAAGAESKR